MSAVPSRSYLFSSESVSEGHPDKAADQVSDAILDWALTLDPNARVACETLLAKNLVVIAGEFGSQTVPDLVERLRTEAPRIARATLRDIGYTRETGLDVEGCEVKLSISKQSGGIAAGVSQAEGVIGAGDQGLMFGYACDETTELMPLPISLAHALVRQQSKLRRSGALPWLRPDAKSQVTVRYENGRPVAVERVVLSTQHSPGIGIEELRAAVLNEIILAVIPKGLRSPTLEFLINPTGDFEVGGPEGDTGLTGRKIIVDSYGGSAPHGGGAYSGKDPTKVDRSAAYAARWLAKNIVAGHLARRCTVQLAYAIGVPEPVSLYLDFHGTGRVREEAVEAWLCENVKLTPAGIIERLNLRRPIYAATSVGGHFGREREEFKWEGRELMDELVAEFGYMPFTPELYTAYRATDYVVLASPSMTLRVDEECEALDALLVQSGKRTAAFLTAWNPYGKTWTDEENEQAQLELLSELQLRDCVLIEGEGRGRIGDWPSEKSVLAIGLDRAGAEEVGRRFGQNAIVFHELGEPSRLVTLVDMMFGGSATEGLEIDPLAFVGVELNEEEKRLWYGVEQGDLVLDCTGVEGFMVLHVEGGPGMTDTYCDYRVANPDAFREELRASIAATLKWRRK